MSYRMYHQHQLDEITGFRPLPKTIKDSIKIASQVFPFKVSHYFVNELIDWNSIPDDPLFRLVFPLKEMLTEEDQATFTHLLKDSAGASQLTMASNATRSRLNPNPANQKSNIPIYEGRPLNGVQHKYSKTVLLFPSAGQTCHSHCSFCFRWSQFTGLKEEMFACDDMGRFYGYLAAKTGVTDLLITGGDPMVMSTARLQDLLEPIITKKELQHVQNIRFGTKALSFWPYRFTSDHDADGLLRLFERLISQGKHVALMAHFNHPRELETAAVKAAIQRIIATGVIIRTQGPLLARINDNPAIWRELWHNQLKLGLVPYYMFMERDTGAKDYFAVSIVHALDIYQRALEGLSGLARTVRGPVMATSPGKIEVLGVMKIGGQSYLSLRFLQARKKEWENKQFLAQYSAAATWINDLIPAFNEPRFFFADEPE